jgi:hypothetical protein
MSNSVIRREPPSYLVFTYITLAGYVRLRIQELDSLVLSLVHLKIIDADINTFLSYFPTTDNLQL